MSRVFRIPRVFHITTCLYCGFRHAAKPGDSYPERCENDGGPLEHYVTAITDPDELTQIRRDGQDSRRPTHSYSVRRAA